MAEIREVGDGRSMTTNQDQYQTSHANGGCCAGMRAEVADAAYHIYVSRGSHDGADLQNWFEAEAHVRARHAADRHAHHHSMASGSSSSR